VCGRLLCCLAYERDQYSEVKRMLPKRGAIVNTQHGKGRVVQVNVIKETMQVELETQVTVEVTQAELEEESRHPARKRRRRGHSRS
jgi:cell fate regulator YaaT (PSP1 superfamily)